jgi:hypothetical protein
MFNSNKPGPKKRASKIKIYEDTKGDHRLSPDGTELFIGGSRFVRTVLPSVAAPRTEDAKLNAELETIDDQVVKEAES